MPNTQTISIEVLEKIDAVPSAREIRALAAVKLYELGRLSRQRCGRKPLELAT